MAIGMESGNIELWAVGKSGDDDTNKSCRLLFAMPPNLCHIADVKKVSFRPSGGDEELILASCGMDNGVRLFSCVF